MSVVRFSDIQSIIIEIQTYHAHRPIIIGMYDHEYHIALNSNNNHNHNNHNHSNHNVCDIDIDSKYFISSISFESCHNKFRFTVKRKTNKCFIYGFKIGAHRKTVLSEYQWYKTIRCKLSTKNKSIIPILFAIGFCHKLNRYGLIVSIDGVSLNQIIKQNKNKLFNIETSIFILYKSIDCISYLHDINVIHGDIKYGNLILMNNSNIGLIDFDSTIFYNKLSENICNLDINAFEPFRGTPLFASIDAHNRKLLTKRSDLISLLFSILYGYNQKLLIWNNIHDINDMNHIKLRKIKFLSSIHKYLNNTLFPKEFMNVFNYIINLKYHESPNYEHIKNILECWLKTIDDTLIQCGSKQIAFLSDLKKKCYKEYQCHINQMDID